MKKYIFYILLCLLPLFQVNAATCTNTSPGEVGNRTFALPAANVTLSEGIPDYTVLYTFNNIMTGITQGSCSGGGFAGTFLTLVDLPPGNSLSYNGYIIFPTSISGIGMSVKNSDTGAANAGLAVPPYPIMIAKTSGTINGGIGAWVEIKLWKIPGQLGGGNQGVLNFTGPTVEQGFVLAGGYSFINTDMSASPAGSKLFWTSSSRIITGSATFTNGTCQLSTGDKTVEMGTYDANIPGAAPWVDASFTLKCPPAAGYGGSYAGSTIARNTYALTGGTATANTIKNANLTITIVPLTSIVTQNDAGAAVQGAIALDGTGAKGYGVQLAWGDAGSLGTGQPAKPVELNTPVLASQISSAFTSGSYTIGQAMPTSAIKMAARFIRTSTDSQPGDAKASIEVIANYN